MAPPVYIPTSSAPRHSGRALARIDVQFHTGTPIDMTWEELIAKAEEHARRAGISVERLHKPKVRETALVSFISKSSAATAKFHLDAITGELISAEFSGPEFTPKSTGKQLSKSAQRVLALASEESKRMGCDHVGGDHLLLGLLVHGKGSGAAVLLSAGLTAEAVRHRIATIGSTAEVPSNGYGPSMRNVLRLSTYHAETLGDPEIEPEHFVLGLLDKVDGPAMSLFRHFSVDVSGLRRYCFRGCQTRIHENQPRRRSEPEPAGSPAEESNISDGWLGSLNYALGPMRNFPTSLRFENREMQQELWTAVERLGLDASQDPDGTLRFKAEDWGAINTEAHKLRDKRFGEWYFMMNVKPEAMLARIIQRLRAHSLPYEVEFHDSRVLLLLPTCDERRHQEILLE